MNIEDAGKVPKQFSRNPKKFILGLIILVLVLVFVSFISGFFGERGKQLALPDNKRATNSLIPKAGSVSIQGDLQAGNGNQAPGGNVLVKAGDGSNGASGGDITVGPGLYKAGDGGTNGKGGDLTIKAGDAH